MNAHDGNSVSEIGPARPDPIYAARDTVMRAGKGGQRVVFTSGTFDLFHYNHLKMINYARGLGDVLIVGVNTDELVSSYKAAPVIPFEERIAIVAALRDPDVVIPQHSLDHREKAKLLNLDVFVVGDDWAGKFDYLYELGVQVFYFPYGKGVSSTELKGRIAKRHETPTEHRDRHKLPHTAAE